MSEQGLPLVTQYLRAKNIDLLNQFYNAKEAKEKVSILHETLLRMGDFSTAEVSVPTIKAAKEELDRVVGMLNKFSESENLTAIDYWTPSAGRLAHRISLAEHYLRNVKKELSEPEKLFEAERKKQSDERKKQDDPREESPCEAEEVVNE